MAPNPKDQKSSRGSKGKAPTYCEEGGSQPNSPADLSTFNLSGSNLQSTTKLSDDGRLVLDLRFAKLLPDLPPGYANDVAEPFVEKEPVQEAGKDKWKGVVPNLNILLMLVGSRGDVQPFIALGLALVAHGHRVRIATHGVFKDFVHSASGGRIEHFDIGGDPKELLAWMVKNPGLMPGFESLTNGDVGRKKKTLAGIMHGCYLATHMPDAETGRRFTPDVLMANPPSSAHIHLAEALGLPLHLTFCMPWSPTIDFTHPLVQIKSSNAKKGLTNYLSFAIADLFTWQGLSGITNLFRRNTLGVPPLSGRSGPSVVDRLKVPWTYCWSPSVIPKPKDWKNTTDVSGFYFLDGNTGYQPHADLQAFLDAGEVPIYIGFGSVPVTDPAAMSAIIFDAVERAGVRAVVSVGWGGLGGVNVDRKRIFLLGDVPHDWLFQKVRAVVHHGGAGTTAIGLLNGRPTVIVPFFGDQHWWGEAVAKAGAGPPAIPGKHLTVEKLVEALQFVCSPQSAKAARAMGAKIRQEDGIQAGVDSFHRHLPLKNMRCDVDPTQVAVWWSRSLCLRLSSLAAQVLADAGKIKMAGLEPHRPKEYATRKQASDPITGGATAVLECVAAYSTGLAEIFYNPPKGLLHVTTAIPRGMLDIIINVHEGFANLPKSYGSDIRRAKDSDVKNFSTGLEEGAKDLAFGIWDACTGLVMEPIQGGKKEGAVGVAKGVGQSWLNLIMRPAAGALALVALPAHGALKSLEGTKAKELLAIRDIRLKDGQDAFALASPTAKLQILQKFKELEKQTSTRRKAFRGEAWRFLGTKMKKADKSDKLVVPPPLTLLDGTEDDEEVDWMKPPSYDDVQGRTLRQ